jgi:polyferredoxin
MRAAKSNSNDAPLEKSVWRKLQFPIVIAVVFWAIAIALWQRTGRAFFLFDIGYIGTSLGVGIGLFALLPRRNRPIGRRLAQFLVGVYMVGFLGFLVQQNMQLEGLFFIFCTGIFAGAIIHYSIAKLFGPLLFGRGFCGWACWTAMVLDLLPYTRSRGRLPGGWDRIRHLHFAVSLLLVASLVFLFGVRSADYEPVYWMAAGNLFYYLAGIALAFALKDNRAFCKYACPVPVLMKIGSRFSLMKIGGDAGRCDRCGACEKACPMDIRITDYIHAGKRVLSTECILCQTCVSVCPTQALADSCGIDAGGRELLRLNAAGGARQ